MGQLVLRFVVFTFTLELPGQLAFKTSSSKKRKLSSRPSPREQQPAGSPSPDLVLPSCEIEDDPSFSFSAASVADGLDSPSYLRADSIPASSLPPRLQTQASNLVSTDCTSSAASSPSISAYADLSLESDKGGDETGLAIGTARSQSPFRVSKRAMKNGDTDEPNRSSSPLKRRASSMDPQDETNNSREDAGLSQVTSAEDVATQAPMDDGSRAMSVDITDPVDSTNGRTSPSKPPLMEQVKIIETLLKAFGETPLKEGDTAYLVSRSWVNQALALRGDSKDAKFDRSEEPLGPVDNSDIIEEVLQMPTGEPFVRFKPGAGPEEFELFPEDAWKMVVDWYGIKDGQLPIIRTAINTAPDAQSQPNIIYEFHLPIFRVYRLWSEVSPLPIEQSLKARSPAPLVIVRSRKHHAQTFIKEIKTACRVPLDRKIRLWTVPRKLPAGGPSESRPALTPPDSPGRVNGSDEPQDSWSKLLLDAVSFSEVSEEKIQVPIEDHTGNTNYNGSAPIQLYDLVMDQTLVIDEQIEKQWVSTYNGKSKGADKSIPNRGNALTTSAASSGRSSPAASTALTRGRAQQKRSGRSVGAVGLQNLGNTCYMNSALQCVRSVEELTKYFLTDAFTDEVNKTNPLGYHGKVAMAYGGLLKEIYNDGRASVSPRDFKTTVGRCRSTFSGWGQQDSQEFLGFLLDGLQEDLSRVKKKPYIEKPDSTDEMIDDPEAIRKMAEQVWDITRKRDDSVIADLFTGMYKSTLKCPDCGKISITFDPFNNLTLPLPVESVEHRSIKFLPLNDVPVKIDVELPKHSSIEALKQFISIRTGVPAERLIAAEEYNYRFFKIYDNAQDVSEEIGKKDLATIHELEAVPTNGPGKARKKFRSMLDIDTPPEATEWDDPRYERLVVPVFHRRPSSKEGASPPHFIILTRKEASNLDTIRRKVLEKVATFSTWAKLKGHGDSDMSESTDAEMVNSSISDADSSGESKIGTRSVEGENDMVDVTMKYATDTTDTTDAPTVTSNKAVPQLLKHFNKRRPKFVEVGSFLDPELQNLFELSYAPDNSEGAIPTGWSSLNATKTFPKLADRMPQSSVEEEDEDHHSPEGWNSTPSGNEEESNDESQKPEGGQTRMMDESSDEDAPQPAQSAPRPMNGGRKKFNGKTYSKKGRKRREKYRNNKHVQKQAAVKPQPMPLAVADGGPLIRLGEVLVVDWDEVAWNTVFGGSPHSTTETQDSRTFENVGTLNDPALRISQRRREHRKNRGVTLDECLDEFERTEILSEQDMWYCPRCKEHRRASKKFDLWKTPDILVAHLKRFSNSGWRRDKLDVLVAFPIEGLDLTSRVIEKEDGKPEIYDLIGVDDHYGGLGGGHYTAYAKNFVDGRWYNYNDSSVSPVPDPSSCITSAAYLLFYRRRSNGPLGGKRFAEIFETYKKEGDDSETEAGEDQRLGGGSSLVGSPSAGTGAAATRRQLDRGSSRTTVTALAGADDEGDDGILPYEGIGTGQIHNSIEDEGVSMADGYQQLGPEPLNMTQGWSFNGIPGSGAEDSADADVGSDEAQRNSSADERDISQEFDDPDTEMATGDGVHEATLDPRGTQGVISVVPENSEGEFDEVAEIHLENDKGTKDSGQRQS